MIDDWRLTNQTPNTKHQFSLCSKMITKIHNKNFRNNHLFLIILSANLILNVQVSSGNRAKCYDHNVLGYFYGINVPVEDAHGGVVFTVPGSMAEDKTQKRLFAEPYPWERDNLWVRSVRKERYEEALMEIVCLSNYGPAQIQAFQQAFLDKAPEPIRNSVLYEVLSQWFASGLSSHQTISEITSSITINTEKITDILSGLEQLSNLYLSNAGPKQVSLFEGTDFAVYQSPTTWQKIKDWIEPLAEAGEAIERLTAAIEIRQDVRDIIVTTFLASIMANDSALERLELIGDHIKTEPIWNDLAFQDAYTSVKNYLEAAKYKKVIQNLFSNIVDHLPELSLNAVTVSGISVNATAIHFVNDRLISLGFTKLSPAAAGQWSIGVSALIQEFKLILGISRQLENAELSVACSTIANNLCQSTPDNCLLKVPAMYGYFASARYVIEAFDWEPLPFWKFGADTVALWSEAEDYFLSHLNQEFNTCSPELRITAPIAGSILQGQTELSAEVHDDIGTREVEFWYSDDGSSWQSIGIDTIGTDGWSINFDSSSITYDDTFWFAAIARDGADPPNVSTRDSVHVSIDNRTQEPGLAIEPLALNFQDLVIGQTAQLSYTVENTGTASMSWQASTSVDWLTLSMDAKLFTPGEKRTIVVTVNTNDPDLKGEQTYNTTIFNTSDAGDVPVAVKLSTLSSPINGRNITRNPTQDAYIMQEYPEKTYNSNVLVCRKRDGWDNAALIQFNTDDLRDDGAVIKSATLELYCSYYNNDDNDPQDLSLYRATKDWDESSVTWNSNGNHYMYESDTIDCDGVGEIKDINVLEHLRSWVQYRSSNYGFFIRYPAPSNGNKQIWFHSSENSIPPKLHISYVIPDGINPTVSIQQPYGGQVFNNPNITVSGTAYDASGLDYVKVRVNEGNWQYTTGLQQWSAAVSLNQGDNLIEVKAKDNSTESKTLILMVRYEPMDFELSCSPPVVTVKQSDSSYFTAFLTSINGFSSSVQISMNGLPSGVQSEISSNPLVPTDSTIIQFTASQGTVSGSYPLTVNASGGGVSKSYPITLTVMDGISPTISIVSPTTETIYETSDKNIVLSGTASDSESGLLAVLIDSEETNSGTLENWAFNLSLQEGWTTFQVTAIDGRNNKADAIISIKYTPPLPSQATGEFPANNATDIPVNQDLTWIQALYASSYGIYLGGTFDAVQNADTNATGIYRGAQTETSFDPGLLTSNTLYYWRVDSKNSSGIVKGNVWKFTTSPPVLIGDVNNDLVVNIFDLVLVSVSFGRSQNDGQSPEWTFIGDGTAADVADVNDDGTVNIFDLVIISTHFGEQYP